MPAKKKAAPRTAPGSRLDVSNILERVTRAEERVISMDRTQIEWRDETRAAHADFVERLTKMEAALLKYQGAWGFLTIVLSALAAAWAMFHEGISRKLGWSS